MRKKIFTYTIVSVLIFAFIGFCSYGFYKPYNPARDMAQIFKKEADSMYNKKKEVAKEARSVVENIVKKKPKVYNDKFKNQNKVKK